MRAGDLKVEREFGEGSVDGGGETALRGGDVLSLIHI